MTLEQDQAAKEVKQAVIEEFVCESLHPRICEAGDDFKEALAGKGLDQAGMELLAYLISRAIELNTDSDYRIVGKIVCDQIKNYTTPILKDEADSYCRAYIAEEEYPLPQ